MNKNIFIGTGIVVFILLLVGSYFFWKLYSEQTQEITIIPAEQIINNDPVQTSTVSLVKKPIPASIQKDGKISVPTKDKEVIFVNDFFKNKGTVIYEEMGATLKVHPHYTLLYFSDDQSFLIGLTGGDLHTVRTDAEKELITILGITEDEACQISVVTRVPSDVNKKASIGGDYGLSFCPSGKQLPKNL